MPATQKLWVPAVGRSLFFLYQLFVIILVHVPFWALQNLSSLCCCKLRRLHFTTKTNKNTNFMPVMWFSPLLEVMTLREHSFVGRGWKEQFIMMLLLFIIFRPGGRLQYTPLAVMMSPCETHLCVFIDDKKMWHAGGKAFIFLLSPFFECFFHFVVKILAT